MKSAQNRFILSFFILFFINSLVFSQDSIYYSSINTSNPTFVTDLESRIRSPYTRISYDNFDETNIANFASINNGNGTRSVFCVYTRYEYIYTGVFTWSVMSREHTWAQSWMPTYPSTSNDQYSDQHHLFPAHQNNANGRRSNHPYGIVVNVTYQFMEGKVGTNSNGGIVYEPSDKHKGDAARALLYMAVRYDGISGNSWNFNWLNGTRLPSLGEVSQDMNLLLDWNRQDPPDKWEVDRNNYVQSIQQNRNPFTDHPEYINYINFNDLSKLNPVYATEPTNFPTSFTSSVVGNDVQLNWNDATGGQLPSGYLIIAYNYNNYFIPIDGSVYTDDTNLSDGAAVVNIPYANANNFTFTNLTQNTNYYFSVFSYNGSGSQINYKTVGTFPKTNIYLSGGLAAEPSNHVTDFTTGSITSNSIQTTWTDAVPGAQVPSGYLLIANNDNAFVTPADGTVYPNDTNLTDGYARINIDYNAPDNYKFNNLFSSTNYFFRIYSYNGTGTQINYKTDGTIPSISTSTTGPLNNYSYTVLDNFNRANNNSLGNTLAPNVLPWQETETASPTSISLSSGRIKQASTTTGREFAYVNTGALRNYPVQFSSTSSELIWAVNMRQTRADPSGFDNNNYGLAFILGKSTTDITTGNGYAVVLGQSGSTDAIRLAKFTGGVNANSKFTNIISSGDYANEYLSIKVVYNPSGNQWKLYVDNNASAFPQTDPANAQTQIGIASDSTYTYSSLPYLGALWNHATGAADSAVFDDVVIPGLAPTLLNLTGIMEGLYSSQTGTMIMKDSLKVYLRNSVSPYALVDSSKAKIDSVNFTGNFIFNNTPSGTYYLQVIHRNSIETWSKLPVTITSGVTTNYNFTDSPSKAYGDNLKQVNNKYCFFSGDVNNDGIIDGADISKIENDIESFETGYVNSDLNGDYFVDASDLSIADNNIELTVILIRP